MSSIVFLIAVIMIAIVIVWSIINDNIPVGGETRWLLAMKDELHPTEDQSETHPPPAQPNPKSQTPPARARD